VMASNPRRISNNQYSPEKFMVHSISPIVE
jgi:hypothetical protein